MTNEEHKTLATLKAKNQSLKARNQAVEQRNTQVEAIAKSKCKRQFKIDCRTLRGLEEES